MDNGFSKFLTFEGASFYNLITDDLYNGCWFAREFVMFHNYKFYNYLFLTFVTVVIFGFSVWLWYEHQYSDVVKVLRVGVVHGLPLGSSGDLHDGFNWDLAQFIKQKLHSEIQYKELNWSQVVKALRTGDVDVVCASFNITNERLRDLSMIHVYGKPHPYATLLFWDDRYKKELGNVKHIRETQSFFEKYAIGISIHGTIWEDLLQKHGIKNIKAYEQESHLISGLRQGEVAAIVLGRVSSDFIQNQYQNLWILQVALDKPYSYGIGVALNPEHKDMIQQITNAIQDLKDEGTITMLQQKWFGKIY